MKAHITKRLVDSLKPIPDGRLKVYDDQLTGFGVVVLSTGKRSFFLEYGPKRRRRRMVLGPYGALTVDAARSMAAAKLGDVAQGGDPLADRNELAKAPTFAEWVDGYMVGVRLRKKDPRHDDRYLGMAKVCWGTRLVREITRRDVQIEMERMAERGHTTANRWLASVRACLHAGCREGVISEDPAWGIRPFREAPPRSRVLTDEEFARVVEVFKGLADPHLRAIFVLLLDTGARKSEALRARWEDFDLVDGIWRIPSPKAGHPQVVPLGPDMVAMLQALPRLGPWLAPGRDPDHHRTDLKRPWEEIREAAGLGDVTIHDLRRTFGVHVAKKAGLHVASKMLRHSDIRVTERVYVPLGIEALREAGAAMREQRGKVLEMHRKAR